MAVKRKPSIRSGEPSPVDEPSPEPHPGQPELDAAPSPVDDRATLALLNQRLTELLEAVQALTKSVDQLVTSKGGAFSPSTAEPAVQDLAGRNIEAAAMLFDEHGPEPAANPPGRAMTWAAPARAPINLPPSYIAQQLAMFFHVGTLQPGLPVGNLLKGAPGGVTALWQPLNQWPGFAPYGLNLTAYDLIPVRTVLDLVNTIYWNIAGPQH